MLGLSKEVAEGIELALKTGAFGLVCLYFAWLFEEGSLSNARTASQSAEKLGGCGCVMLVIAAIVGAVTAYNAL